MGHLRNICYPDCPVDILSQGKRQFRLRTPESVAVDHIAQHDDTVFFIRDLDADRVFTGNRRFHTNGRSGQIHGYIIRQIDNTAYLDPLSRLKLITGDGRSPVDLNDFRLYLIIAQSCFQLSGTG